jgi:hypothetical protein
MTYRGLQRRAKPLGFEIYRGIPGYQVHHLNLDVWFPNTATLDLEEVEAVFDGYEGVGKVWADGPPAPTE